jgi:hypothetical protein
MLNDLMWVLFAHLALYQVSLIRTRAPIGAIQRT